MAFTTSRPLRFGDCDPAGIAYYPAYLDMLNGVVEEFFASFGLPWTHLFRDLRTGLPTVRLELEFTSPGFHGDIIDFTIGVKAIGNSSLDLEHRVATAGRALWNARHRLVATSLDTHKAMPWPENFRTALGQHLENDNA